MAALRVKSSATIPSVSSGDTASNIKNLVEGIKKNKNFKQLAVYQIHSIQKPLSKDHNRYGWEAAARDAFGFGAVEEIAEIAGKFSNDAALFQSCFECLSSLANVPKCVPAVMSNSATSGQIISAVRGYMDTVDMTSNSLSDALNVVVPALALLALMVRQDAGAFDKAGGISLLLDLGSSPARPKPGAAGPAAKNAESFASYVQNVASILDRASRIKQGLDAFFRPASVEKLLKIAALNLQTSAAADSRSQVRTPKKGETSSSSNAKPQVNAHIEPAFRVLDRIARTDAGRDTLLAAGATSALSPIMSVVLKIPSVAPLAMRVLARLLGSNVAALIDRIAGVNKGAPADLRERILCARLLAFMLKDDECVATLTADNGALVKRLVDIVHAAPLASTDGAAALVSVFRKLADHSTEHIPMLEEAGVIPVVHAILRTKPDNIELVSECIGFFASVIDCNEMVLLLSNPPEESVFDTAITLALSLVTNKAVAAACLSFVERALLYDAVCEDLVNGGAINLAVAAMRALPKDADLQLLATDVLIYLGSTASHVDAMVSAGAADLIIRNLSAEQNEEDVVGQQTDDNADDDEDLQSAQKSNKQSQAIAANLVASSLYLVTSLCAVEAHIDALKECGIIHAVLTGFSRHIHDVNVYRNFREVISALNIEEREVVEAIHSVAAWTTVLQESYNDNDIFKPVDEYVTRVSTEGCDVFSSRHKVPVDELVKNSKGEVDMNSSAERLLEHISLLEAVTVSPVFVCVISAHDGVPALLRVLGVVSVVKLLAKAKSTRRKSMAPLASRSLGGAQQGISANIVDDVLARTCNTLAHLARVAYEFAAGQLEQDPEYEPVDFSDFEIAAQLFDKDCLTFISRAMASGAKPQLRQFAAGSITLLSWLASGHSQNEAREHIDALIAVQGIEATVSMLRAHQGVVDVCAAVAGALTRVAVTSKGASAVATRGGSRQIVRTLHPTASLRSNAGDELLLSYLRLLDTIAAAGSEPVDILRRQGTIDAVVACVDAGTAKDFKVEAEESSITTPVDESYTADVVVRADIDATVTSLLSRLSSADLVLETVAFLQNAAADLSKSTASYDPKKPIKLADYQPASIIRAVVRLGLLSMTEAGSDAGEQTLRSGALACAKLSAIGLLVGKACADAGVNVPHSVEAELDIAVPCAFRSIKQLTLSMKSFFAMSTTYSASIGDVAVAAVPSLFRALDEKPDYANEVISTTSVLTTTAGISTSILQANDGRGLQMLVDVLRTATERGDQVMVKDALSALAGVAQDLDVMPQIVASGAAHIALSFLSDNINDASADSLAAAFLLLARCGYDASIQTDLLQHGQVFDLSRTAIQRFGLDPYNPAESLVYSLGELMQPMAVSPFVVSDEYNQEEFRNALKRLVRSGACSTGYIDSARCSTALLKLVALACTEHPPVSKEIAELNREAVQSCGGEDFIVQCMSSYAATQDVLTAGHAALQAVGSADRASELVANIDSYAATIPEWFAQGYTAQEPQVIDLIVSMGDLMKNLASQVVVSGTTLPQIGATYSEALATTWRAVAVVCGEEVVSTRGAAGTQPTGSSGKDLHQSRADALAVGAQIIGRLQTAAAAARSFGQTDEAYAVSASDTVSVLYTILAAAHSVLEVRVVESLCKTAEQFVDDLGETGVHHLCTGKVMAGFMSLLQVIHNDIDKARIAAAGGGIGADADALLSAADLSKCETALTSCVRNITNKFRAALVGSSGNNDSIIQLISDPDSVADVLSSLALTTASVNAGGLAKTDEEEPSASAASAISATETPELNLLAESIVSASKARTDGAPTWSLLQHLARAVECSMQGPTRFAAAGNAPLYTVTTLQSNVRVYAALLRAILAQLGGPLNVPAAAAQVGGELPAEALRVALDAALDVCLDASRKGRCKAGGLPEPADAVPEYTGAESEVLSVKAAFTVSAGVCVASAKHALDILSRQDFSSQQTSVASIITSREFIAPFLFLVSAKEALQAPGLGCATIRAISGLSDLYCKDVLSKKPVSTAQRVSRITALASLGLYKTIANSLGLPSVMDNEEYVAAVMQLLSGVLSIPSVDVKLLALDKQCLLAVNGAHRRFPENPDLVANSSTVVSKLEAVYQEQSGAAFESCIKKVLADSADYVRNMGADGKFVYSKRSDGSKLSAIPPVFASLLDALFQVDMMSRSLEEDAVTAVTPDAVAGLVSMLQRHSHDVGIVGIIINSLGKLAANLDNHEAIVSSGVVQFACKLFAEKSFMSDPRISEGIASLVLPLSFEQTFVKSVLAEADVIPLLIKLIKAYCKHSTTFSGSPAGWLPESKLDYNKSIASMKSDAPDAEERNKMLPRLAQMCVQSLANLACDNEEDESGMSSVSRIVREGGIEALGELMSLHPENPRLLEDSICALSNMAFVSDTIQLQVGRCCMDAVCAAATSFNADSYLFQMTLRAIGNLTRCDENIMRAVGFGVIRGMVEGMTKHADDPSVLQLCADVIGNMASVDDKKVGREDGVRILTDCSSRRKGPANAPPGAPPTAAPPGVPPAGPPPGRPSVAPTPPSAPKTPRPPAQSKQLSPDSLIALVEKAKSLKEAVCTVLYEDGAPRGLMTAMTKHYRNADLAGSCLRAMHYIGASSELVARMVGELDLVDQVVFIMRSIDYRPDVLRRGARVLGLVVGTESLKDKVLQAGAPAMLLQAIETHRSERELCISCYSVLAMARSPAVVAAVREMQAIDTAVNILRQHASDHEFAGVLLELLWGWAAESELATSIATKAIATLTVLLQTYARDKGMAERMQHLSYILNLVLALVRQRVEPLVLIGGELLNGLQIVCEGILGADGSVMLSQRIMVMQCVTIMMDIAKPPSKEKDAPAVVSKAGVQALLREGSPAGPLLEKILTAYKGVPDPRVPGQLLYDQSMCERAHGVLQDLIAEGYTPQNPVTLDAPEDEPAPAAGAGDVSQLAPEVKAEIDTMLSAGRHVEFWSDGKARKCRIGLNADRSTISVYFDDKGKADFAANTIKGVFTSVPAGQKQKKAGLFGGGRVAKAERSVTLVDAEGKVMFHFEVDREAAQLPLAQAFSALSGVPHKPL